ncbi:TIGR00730 family Rossman fold protein [Hymenobacter lutimineralis]|uniref:Cytokinin riboside 5'-monophosphate phosphoribohydrolase n=1 Tax=Hymenobacter lutimineralis TaxID=2606448 RepID=A0A5D6USU6_9BACT|nr:TIGR00730 family Rossman fold protein [Hymenobacter lutimineralis]TYZ06065.1 TIGR00730 family Rossman fold protein [Hymenobacter lutimineralis]
MKSVAVYCGASSGSNQLFTDQARLMGRILAERNLTLVYGGGRVGLMGTIADSVLEHGGQAIGVIPDFLADKELAHIGLTQLHVVTSMHERKLKMAELAEGFVAMPGGYGTLEELFEVLTWGQLGLHKKPVAVLNVAGYYDHLLRALDHMADEELLRRENRSQLLQAADPAALLDQMDRWQPIDVEKWLTPRTS